MQNHANNKNQLIIINNIDTNKIEISVNVQNRSDTFDRHFLVRLGLLKVR